jgi:uncharacterized cupredoxin-like copper-binding protein
MDMQGITRRSAILAFVWAFSFAPAAFGHGDSDHANKAAKTAVKAEQMPFGIAGDPKKVSRTIDVDAHDTFRFSPDKLAIKRGDTIRFVMHNKGNVMHEMVIGTMADLKEHAELMKKFPDMEHEEAHMAHVGPGKSGDIVWQFNRPGTFYFACLIAGHFEGGMVGAVVVQ